MIDSIYKKGTQAINYLARKKDGKINKMKAIKLVYFADRYHVRKYGRPIVGDVYWAMKYGPVASNALRLANLELEGSLLKYVSEFIGHPKGDTKLQEIISKKEVDLDIFSQTELEAIENIYKEFGDRDQFELAQITHDYPEWAKFKSDIIDKGKKRVRMDYVDFFKDPKNEGLSVFSAPAEHLEMAKEIYLENKEVSNLLS